MSERDVLSFDRDGLLPAVVQDVESREVLVLGSMNRESLAATYASGRVTFWSRSRNELWEKGATSGNWLEMVEVRKNCEANSLLVLAKAHGPTCHTGHDSCYYRPLDAATDIPAGT